MCYPLKSELGRIDNKSEERGESMPEALKVILDRHERGRDALIPILQDVQKELGYISPESVAAISRYLRISENEIFGVSSFYAQFRFTAPGRHSVKVCLGTACHVRGGSTLLDSLRERARRCVRRDNPGPALRPGPRCLPRLLRAFPGRTDRRQNLQQGHGEQTDGAAQVL